MNRQPDATELEVRQAALPMREVLTEQLRLLHAHLPRALITFVTATGLTALALATMAPAGLLTAWWVAGALTTGVRFLAARRYLVESAPELALPRFRRDALVVGAVLGLGAAVLAFYTDSVGQSILLVLLLGTLSGAIPVLANDLRSYHLFSLGAILPDVLVMSWSASRGEPRPAWLAALAVLCLVFMLETIQRVHRALTEALTLRFEKTGLVEELRESNARLREDIRLRREAEAGLLARAQFERVISALSTDFVHLPVEEIDEGIHRALQTIGEHAGVDRAYVFLLRDNGLVDNTHEWCAEGVGAEIHNLQGVRFADYPWIVAKIMRQEDVHVPRVANLPPEAAAERAEWGREGIQSIVLVPMILGETVHGYLGFDAVRKQKAWTDDDLGLLRLSGEIFINAIERRKAESRIHRQARYDDLTGLPNRRLFMEHLSRNIALGRRQNLHGAVLFVDLDRFKPINDSLGHGAGDVLLRETSRRLVARLREYDVAARMGGDEFAVLLPQLAADATRAEHEAWSVAEKIRTAVAAPLRVGSQDLRVTASVGIALFPRDADSAEEALEHADVAMYQAKAAGRDAQRFFALETKNATAHRLRLHTELRGAIQRGELEVFLQPQVDGNRRLVGAEGLMRWRHPERGLIGPDEFIPLAEDTGLIRELDLWSLRTACRYLKAWRDKVPADFHIALNMSPATIRDDAFFDSVTTTLRECELASSKLELEVTERLFLMEQFDAKDLLFALRGAKVRVAIDDFGTGYSSLAYLKHLPIDRVKVDKSFVQGVHTNRNDAAIVEAIMGIAASFGYQVIAEGVEDEADFDFLRLLGVWIFQGYLFGRPMPAEEFLRLQTAAGTMNLVTVATG